MYRRKKTAQGLCIFAADNQQANQHNPSMKNNNIFVRMSVICTIIMTVALLGAGIVEEMTVRFAISGGAAVLVWGTYLTLSMKQKHDFSERAMAVPACKQQEVRVFPLK